MGRLLIFFVAAFILDVFALIDLILIDRRRVRAFPKIVWGIIILLVPFIGALLWFFVGHEWGTRGGERRTIAPDDDPSFLKNLRRDEDQDERIRRLEQELADLDDDPPTT
ncbi:MAG TPA: PLD nuclease N-terminal domain-containing protein [Rhodoglobus sp.]|nr:PLD nuclease N-terminal domain-containing protein [Rhodoglobus sp.]HPG76038.1 PLD nuclease N-terminal domain-containing protein [Rhodoglobus sp.]HPM51594.1 PLD nuclease N-terminal domain-containing protein [Rhodoglobus sp.]